MKKVIPQMLMGKTSVAFLPLLGGMSLFLFTSLLVSGKAKDKSGQPLTKAGISVKSSDYDDTTDANGKHFTCLMIKKNELNQI